MKIEKDKGILVININYLPTKYKDKDLEEIRTELQGLYKIPILLLDNSKENTNGLVSGGLPAYRI